MSYDEYIKNFDVYQLHCLQERIARKIEYFKELPKVTLFVVSDESINYAWYDKDNYGRALNMLIKLYRSDETKGINYNHYRIDEVKYNSDEAEELLKDNK